MALRWVHPCWLSRRSTRDTLAPFGEASHAESALHSLDYIVSAAFAGCGCRFARHRISPSSPESVTTCTSWAPSPSTIVTAYSRRWRSPAPRPAAFGHCVDRPARREGALVDDYLCTAVPVREPSAPGHVACRASTAGRRTGCERPQEVPAPTACNSAFRMRRRHTPVSASMSGQCGTWQATRHGRRLIEPEVAAPPAAVRRGKRKRRTLGHRRNCQRMRPQLL